jgi:hypothetical protein
MSNPFDQFMPGKSKQEEHEPSSSPFDQFMPKKPDSMTYQEARVMPRLPFGKSKPLGLSREDRNKILAAIPWEKIRDEVTVPAMNEIEKGTKELKDSTDAYMHRATNFPEWLIEEAVSNYLRKVGK